MKSINHLLIAMLFVVSCVYGASYAEAQKRVIRYVEHVSDFSVGFENRLIQPKAHRVSSKRGNLVLVYDHELPDSIVVALEVARNLWESKIKNNKTVFIEVRFEPSDFDVAMFTEVSYYVQSQGQLSTVAYPSSLASQMNGLTLGSVESPDGVVVLNSNINWNCSFSQGETTGYNVTTMALRGFARSYGFGSGIIEYSPNVYGYNFVGPIAFDYLLQSRATSKPLSSFESGEQFNSFVTSDDVCVAAAGFCYDIYAPNEYDPYMSLLYFKDGDSLMSYTLGQGNVVMQIDDATRDVLREIGWDIPDVGYDISCHDLSKNGVGSAYKQHTFSLETLIATLSSYSWTFKLRTTDGEYALVSTGSDNTFTIEAIKDRGNYYVNVNGDLEGLIECSYSENGRIKKANPLAVSLELEPIILHIDGPVIEKNPDYSFCASFNVVYAGADYLTMKVQEEFDPAISIYRIYEPFIAHAYTDKISSLYNSWVHFKVSNQYGTATETLHFAPDYELNEYDGYDCAHAHMFSVESGHEYDLIVYSVEGQIVYRGSIEQFEPQILNPGIYIKQLFEGTVCIDVSKIIVR